MTIKNAVRMGFFPCSMKSVLSNAAVLAAVFGLFFAGDHASANSFISIESQDTTTLPSVADFITPPNSTKGSFLLDVVGSVPGSRMSPFADTTSGYSVISSNGKPGEATYNLDGATTFSFLWGSPDAYNKVAFFSGPNDTGKLLAVFSGKSLTPSATGSGFDFVTFEAAAGVTIGSVALFEKTGQPAFEFSDVDPPAPTPLPAALPLYIAGIGVMGLLARRRKQKQHSAAA
jgi:hypothetical protein